MPNYSKCVIYTIKTGNNLYVGSSCNYVKRKHAHKSSLNNENTKNHNSKLYNTIRANGGEWEMTPYLQFACASKMEMCIEEERIRKELKADLNSNSCFRTEDERLNYHKDYRTINKDELSDYIKNYYNNNKDKEKLKNRNYYIKNNEKLTEKISCECGGKYTHLNKSKHFKTQKHSNYMLSKEA